jgi:hypothetical protein
MRLGGERVIWRRPRGGGYTERVLAVVEKWGPVCVLVSVRDRSSGEVATHWVAPDSLERLSYSCDDPEGDWIAEQEEAAERVETALEGRLIEAHQEAKHGDA